jgi:predicted ester cyclase
MDVRSLLEDGEHVFVQWHLTGTHTGPFNGLDPTGRSVAVDGMDHFELRDGRVISNFVVFDQMQIARQLGVLPADGSPADRAMKSAFNVKTRVAELINR